MNKIGKHSTALKALYLQKKNKVKQGTLRNLYINISLPLLLFKTNFTPT